MTITFDQIREKMLCKGVSEVAIRCFERAFSIVSNGGTAELSESMISSAEGVLDYDELPQTGVANPDLLAQTAVIKLNGGLGTGMGLEKAKSLLEVRPRVNFLDLMIRQIEFLNRTTGRKVPFLLMNSQATSKDTKLHLAEAAKSLGSPDEMELMQSWAPKLRCDDFSPVSFPENPESEWCPPGHADIYPSLVASGWLDRLLEEGVKYAFISNSDNLGAVLDEKLLTYFATSSAPFLMEVTRRTDADRKGGHLAVRDSDNRLVLREVAQCPEEDLAYFQDISRHRYFNTNNIWLNLKALRKVLAENDGVLPLPVIRNKKTVDPRDETSTPVYQLEAAMGSAIECFDGARAVNVPRTRFAPVKSTGDLLALRSDAYEVQEDGCIILGECRKGVPPLIELSSEYKLVDALSSLGVPSLVGAGELKVSGLVQFEDKVELMGKVSFSNKGPELVSVPAGVYENETWEG